MKAFAYSIVVAAFLAPLAGCVVHDRDVVRDRPYYREEIRHDDRPVVLEHEHHDAGVRVDVRP